MKTLVSISAITAALTLAACNTPGQTLSTQEAAAPAKPPMSMDMSAMPDKMKAMQAQMDKMQMTMDQMMQHHKAAESKPAQ